MEDVEGNVSPQHYPQHGVCDFVQGHAEGPMMPSRSISLLQLLRGPLQAMHDVHSTAHAPQHHKEALACTTVRVYSKTSHRYSGLILQCQGN